MLQYEETAGAWSEIGKMKKARNYHAAVEVDVSLFCPGIVGPTNQKQLSSPPSPPPLFVPSYHRSYHTGVMHIVGLLN